MKLSKIFKKTLVFMIIAFGLIALLSSGYSAYTLRNRMAAEFETKGKAIAKAIASSSVDILLKDDAATIQSNIDQFLEIEGVAYVVVASRKGDIMAHTFVPAAPESVLTSLWDIRVRNKGRLKTPVINRYTVEESGKVLQISYPVLAGEAGAVHIGMDLELIDEAIFDAIVKLQAITLGVFLLCVVAAYFFTENISRPLIRLTEYARKVQAHDFSSTPDVGASNDEVGQLADVLRGTAEELASFISGLQQSVVRASNELDATQATFSAIIGNMADGLFLSDSSGNILQINAALEDMFGAGEETLKAKPITEHLGLGTTQLLALASQGGEGMERHKRTMVVMQAARADGGTFPAEVSLAIVSLEGDLNIVGLVRDVTQRQKAEEALSRAKDELEERVQRRTRDLEKANEMLTAEIAERRVAESALTQAEAKYRGIFENALEGIFQLSLAGDYVDANPAMARIFGYDTAPELLAVLASKRAEIYVEDDRGEEFLQQVRKRGEVRRFESQVQRADGSVIWISQNARAVHGESGEVLFYEGSLEDITDRKEAESRLVHQAFHDPLTGLPNRTLFQDHLRLAMERARRNPGYLFAVLYMDLDRFKIVNDSLGHAVGDELLKHVSRELNKAVRTMDTVARFGGDEFAVLLEDFKAPSECIMIAKRILRAVKTPVRLSGYDVHTAASIGIVLNTENYTRPDLVLRDADTAMYRAKEAGRSRFKVFNKRMHDQAVRLLKLETDLRASVEKKQFTMLYQPMVDLETGALSGFEALVRWVHPQRGMLAPNEFIHMAEDTGLIFPLGEWVLSDVCRTLADWEKEFGFNPGVNISINLSNKQFMQPNLDAQVGKLLAKTGIRPGNLALEITESVLMDHAAAAIDTMSQLKARGVSLSMDDFGTGYSSLSYLRQFPIDMLKIDRSFISRFGEDEEAQVLVRSILTLAENLGIAAVAEGVDTEVQLGMLRELGCQFAQGYLFSRPVPRDEAEALLRGETQLKA